MTFAASKVKLPAVFKNNTDSRRIHDGKLALNKLSADLSFSQPIQLQFDCKRIAPNVVVSDCALGIHSDLGSGVSLSITRP
jgi:hypothetical protein